MDYEEAFKHCIFRFVSGSQAYGTNRPDSDEDYRGVFIAPLSAAFDLFHNKNKGSGSIDNILENAMDCIDVGEYNEAKRFIQSARDPEHGDLKMSAGTVKKPGVDEEMQELRKFLTLAANSNPNIIEFLYVDRLITHETDVWKKIRAKRDMFLSKKARHTFSGYAMSQMSRIETHRGYLMNPPSHKPTRAEFGLPEKTEIRKEHFQSVISIGDKWLRPESLEYVVKERKYKAAISNWDAFEKWERERNPARKELERNFGFDVKHAMHLIRLSRMGVEILRDGVVNVYRPDREELKGVLRGEWTFDQLVAYAEKIDETLDQYYDNSPLRHRPDHEGIADLYREICEEYYGIKIG